MITRIELVNFMSHGHTVIEPAAGLTVLVGPNNVGKSAIVQALHILCRNENSTYVLRHGARQCEVKVHTDDGHVIEWRRKNSPSYTIDGQVFDRLRQSGLPDELHAVLRLPCVDDTADPDFDIHFGAQKSPIFLLASSPANAARFFASSSDAIRLVSMQQRHKDKLAEAQREKRSLDEQSRQLNAELETLAPVADLEKRLQQAERVESELHEAEQRIGDARTQADALARLESVYAEHAARWQALQCLAPPPALEPTDPLADHIERVAKAMRAVESARLQLTALETLVPPPEFAPAESLASLQDALQTTTRCHETLDAQLAKLANLAIPPAMSDTRALAREINLLQAATCTIERGQAVVGRMGPLAAPPALPEASALAALVERLSVTTETYQSIAAQCTSLVQVAAPPELAAVHAVDRFVNDLATAESRARDCGQAVVDVANALSACGDELRASAVGKRCPLCASPLDPARVLAGAIADVGGHDHE